MTCISPNRDPVAYRLGILARMNDRPKFANQGSAKNRADFIAGWQFAHRNVETLRRTINLFGVPDPLPLAEPAPLTAQPKAKTSRKRRRPGLPWQGAA